MACALRLNHRNPEPPCGRMDFPSQATPRGGKAGVIPVTANL